MLQQNPGKLPREPIKTSLREEATQRPRVTVVEIVHYQSEGGYPVSSSSAYGYDVKGDEQPYRRQCRATREWAPLDLGWLEGKPVSLVCVDHNRKVSNVREAPGKSSPVLEVAVETSQVVSVFAVVRCGHTMRLQPGPDFRHVVVRCPQGETTFTITAYPE